MTAIEYANLKERELREKEVKKELGINKSKDIEGVKVK